jgi:hypothetical protein
VKNSDLRNVVAGRRCFYSSATALPPMEAWWLTWFAGTWSEKACDLVSMLRMSILALEDRMMYGFDDDSVDAFSFRLFCF